MRAIKDDRWGHELGLGLVVNKDVDHVLVGEGNTEAHLVGPHVVDNTSGNRLGIERSVDLLVVSLLSQGRGDGSFGVVLL
jgi:hypothetical protein